MKKLAIITGVLEELNDGSTAYDYSIGPILESSLFDEVVLAIPNDERSKPLQELAIRHGIRFFAGEIYNVCGRIRQVLDLYPFEIISRFQLRASWVDMDLVKRSLDLVAEGYDYADYAYDVNYAMGADTFSLDAFNRVERHIFDLNYDDPRKRTFEFSPWAYLQDRSFFNVGVVEVDTVYPLKKSLDIRQRLDLLIGSKQNMIGSPVDYPALRYVKVADLISSNWNVAEISSGYGGGAAYLSKFCKEVTAYEINADYINFANNKYSKYNVRYIHGGDDILGREFENFDCVVSLHTLEHVPNDRLFLENIQRSLRHGGYLIIEVPRLMEKPMGMPLWPFHEREYTLEAMRDMLNKCGLSCIQEFGVSRNEYVSISKAREAMMFVAKKL